MPFRLPTALAVIVLAAQPAAAESRDMSAGALQLMCGMPGSNSKARNEIGCAAFLDGFVRGYTRAKGCPEKEYEPVRRLLVGQPPERVRQRLADEVLAEIVSSLYTCRRA